MPIKSSSTDATPVTGSLVFSTLLDCLDKDCAAEFASCLLFGNTDCVWLARFGLFFWQVSVSWIMATDGAALVEGRYWSDAAESQVLQGRDVRSVRVLVLDSRGLDQNFHDVTIVDMGDVPESSISLQELFLLPQQWPPAVLRHMVWLQQDLEAMRVDAKKRFRQTKLSNCGTWIKCDMYRHVAKFHLDLAQLWRCPVSWCTVWKGTPQDCMDHVRGANDVPWVVKSASMEQFVPPLTVRRQVWSDSLKQSHSGISTDVLLFSDINLSLVHHYRVHKRGLLHVAFRKDYMARLRALLPPPVAQSQDKMLSPVPTSPASSRQARSAELGLELPIRTRRARRRVRPVRVMGESVRVMGDSHDSGYLGGTGCDRL